MYCGKVIAAGVKSCQKRFVVQCPVAKFLKFLNSVVSCFCSWSVCVSGVLSLVGSRRRVAE